MPPKRQPDGTCGCTCRSLGARWHGADAFTGENFECEWAKNPETKSFPRMTQYGETGMVNICRRSGGAQVPVGSLQ
ncbi:unnamed protein product, partial [Prorocentrum cordatum]